MIAESPLVNIKLPPWVKEQVMLVVSDKALHPQQSFSRFYLQFLMLQVSWVQHIELTEGEAPDVLADEFGVSGFANAGCKLCTLCAPD